MEFYAAEVHAMAAQLRTLNNRVAQLHGVVHRFGDAAWEIQRTVPGPFTVDIAGNGAVLASLQDVREDITQTMSAVEVLTTLFQQMEGKAVRTAEAFRMARDALAADNHLL